jgi:uroporphyrinogen-III decarboxylase
MEGITHPSIGDFPLKEAKKIHPKFIVNGGMSAAEQEITENSKELLKNYVKSLMEEMKPDRFIFASSCQTSPKMPYENLLYFKEYCLKYGTRR